MSVPGALQATITMVGRGFIEEETELAPIVAKRVAGAAG
jgi:hypothetical protein